MEYQKIIKLLDTIPDNLSRFITKKWIEVHDQSGKICNTNKQMRFKTSMLQSDLCDYRDAYIVVKGTITVRRPDITGKNNSPFISCISKINNILIDNAEHLDIVVLMYNLIEYSKNYSKTSGSLWNYYRDEPNSGAEGNISYSVKDSIFFIFDYKTSIIIKLDNKNIEKENVEIAVPLKYLCNFWRIQDTSLIIEKVSLTLNWYGNCVLTSKATRDADSDIDLAVPRTNNPTGATFKIKDTKLYVPVVTLSSQADNKLKAGFKRTIKWNKYRSKITTHAKTNNLNYLIDPIFSKVNKLFVLSFKNEDD